MDYIENRTFDEIQVGDSARLIRTLTKDDINVFAAMSGDVNPAHMDEEYARSDLFHKIIGHGMWGGSLISTLLGTKLPGPGAIYLSQTLTFRKPIAVGDRITVSVTATAKDPEKHRVTFDCECSNDKGEVVIAGTALVLAPTEKVKRPRATLPQVRVYDPVMRYQQLEYLADAQGAGIVLGARVPIALASRAEKPPSRIAACAIALLLARRPRNIGI